MIFSCPTLFDKMEDAVAVGDELEETFTNLVEATGSSTWHDINEGRNLN